MTNSTSALIPGEGMSYSDLCAAADDSPARLMWRALGDFASVLGIEEISPGIGMRSKTVDELLAEIREITPANFDIASAAQATLTQSTQYPRYAETYEVRRLVVEDTEEYWYATDAACETFEEAVETKNALAEQTGMIYAIVKVKVTREADVYPANYVPRR